LSQTLWINKKLLRGGQRRLRGCAVVLHIVKPGRVFAEDFFTSRALKIGDSRMTSMETRAPSLSEYHQSFSTIPRT